MTALNALLKKRFEEFFDVRDTAKSDPELAELAVRIERGDTAPGALRSQDPEWVAARLWDRALTDGASLAGELRLWVDRWRLLGWPSLVAHKVWSEAAATAFQDTALAVLASEPGLAGWDETRAGFIRQISLRTGQPPARGESHIPPLPASLLDRAVWLGDLRLEGAIAGMMSANQELVGLIRLLLRLVKPFSMALLGWLFIAHLFRPFLPADQIDGYIAGLILLAAAPCTAMVFVWSNLVDGEPHFTLSQVALNDTIMVVAFRPDCGAAARPVRDHGALEHADSVGRALHRGAGDRGATLAALAAGARRGRGACPNASRLGSSVPLGAAADACASVRPAR